MFLKLQLNECGCINGMVVIRWVPLHVYNGQDHQCLYSEVDFV